MNYRTIYRADIPVKATGNGYEWSQRDNTVAYTTD